MALPVSCSVDVDTREERVSVGHDLQGMLVHWGHVLQTELT